MDNSRHPLENLGMSEAERRAYDARQANIHPDFRFPQVEKIVELHEACKAQSERDRAKMRDLIRRLKP